VTRWPARLLIVFSLWPINFAFAADGRLPQPQPQTQKCTTYPSSTPAPTLTIKTIVDGRGIVDGADPILFTMTKTETPENSVDSKSCQIPGSSSDTIVKVEAGASYSVRRSGGPSPYAMTTSDDCTGTMKEDSKICTVTNTYEGPRWPYDVPYDWTGVISASMPAA